MDLKEKVKLLPEVPGVYLMKDYGSNIIYVGKSKNLKSRVGQYFRSFKNHSPKVVKMVQGIRDFEYIITDTEFEALLLECRLIKEIKPIYNSQMKNDLGYVYVKITIEEKFPRVTVSEEKEEDGSMYFGPFTSLKRVERAVAVIRENYQIRSCSGVNVQGNRNGCLSYQLGFCTAPCTDAAAKNAYINQINEVISFLKVQDKNLMEKLRGKMQEASQKLDFNKAAKYRDDMYALNHILNRQKTISFTKGVRNIAALERVGSSQVKLFLIKDSSLLYSEKMQYNCTDKCEIKKKIKDSILEYLKVNENKETKKIDKQDIDQAQIIFSYLKNRKNNCKYIIIPNSWIKHSEINKLDNGIDKLLFNFEVLEEEKNDCKKAL